MTEVPSTPPQPEPFGVHLMIDGYHADGPVMTAAAALRGLLEMLPAEMGMHAICPVPIVSVGPNC